MTTKKAVKNFLFWVGLALAFNLFIFFYFGQEKAVEFFGGYIIEQSLSLDNLFLFLVIFNSFGVTAHYQKRVLNYGIIGAIILRLVFVVLGVAIVSKFHWILYIFGLILIFSGIKIMVKGEEESDLKDSKVIRFMSRFIPFTENLDGEKFFTKKNGILHATPLLAMLIIIESSDIIFAIDSIPAIFSITTDAMIVYSSNIFAILGLRNLYFLIEKLNDKFKYVKVGVACILVFTGIKLAVLFFHVEISVILSVSIIFSILLLSIFISMIIPINEEERVQNNEVI